MQISEFSDMWGLYQLNLIPHVCRCSMWQKWEKADRNYSEKMDL